MKILQVCKKFPYPPKDGEMIAIFNFSESFVQLGHELTLLSLNTNKHYYDIATIPKELSQKIQFELVAINTDLKFSKALSSLVKNTAYNIDRFYSKEFETRLITLLSQNAYDLILLEGLPLLLYIDIIKKNSESHIAYRAHNVEYEIWQRLANNSTNIFKKIYLTILSQQVKAFEKKQIPKADSVIPISERDNQLLKSLTTLKKSYVAPACISDKKITIDFTNTNFESLFFLGALDWQPNKEGLIWFIEQVYPSILKELPNTKLYIGGRNIPNDFMQRATANIVILGEIASVNEYVNSHQIMIVPLLSGGGMRIKIIEAMLYSKCIISTDIGAEGIEDENSIIRCSNASIFATKTIEFLKDKKKQKELGEKAKLIANEKYNAIPVSKKLVSFFEPLIHKN